MIHSLLEKLIKEFYFENDSDSTVIEYKTVLCYHRYTYWKKKFHSIGFFS